LNDMTQAKTGHAKTTRGHKSQAIGLGYRASMGHWTRENLDLAAHGLIEAGG
jgi:hypothetical protein